MSRGPVLTPRAKAAGVTMVMVLGALGVGANLAKPHEGTVYVAYDDFLPRYPLKPGDKVWGTLTVCTGHTDAAGGPPIIIGKVYTPAECDAYLRADMAQAAQAVLDCTPALYRNTWAAGSAISFAFNVGRANYCSSTMARKFNAGDIRGGCDELSKWIYSKGKELRGLKVRRADERKTCLTELEPS